MFRWSFGTCLMSMILEVKSMGRYQIQGGQKLSGELTCIGAKNAMLPILVATVLNGGISVVHNCPRLRDTEVTVNILKSLGCGVVEQERTIIVDSSGINNICVPNELVNKMRSSIIFMGGLLGRFKEVAIGTPGGCELGLRPLDLHFKAMEKLGAKKIITDGQVKYVAAELVGANINLDFPSVGATQNIMLAAVYAKGTTKIANAAKEPEIVDLQDFLNAQGAKIAGAGTSTITITGVDSLNNCEYTVMPDRIVAGTYLGAAAITQGDIRIKGINHEYMFPITSKFAQMGMDIKTCHGEIVAKSSSTLKSIHVIRTDPHPGFPTDMQSQLTSVLAIVNGSSIIEETIFEERNKHIPELIKMGADIKVNKNIFTINGVRKLTGATVYAKELRGGAALILAGLAAQGETIVYGSEYIERGYENITSDLCSLGADIVFC